MFVSREQVFLLLSRPILPLILLFTHHVQNLSLQIQHFISKKNHFSLNSVYSFHNDPCFLFMNWFSMHLLYFFPILMRKNLYKPIFLLLSSRYILYFKTFIKTFFFVQEALVSLLCVILAVIIYNISGWCKSYTRGTV